MSGRARRWVRPVVLGGLLVITAASGCGEDEPEPVRVARDFAEAVSYRDVDQILEMVDAQTVARIQQAAERASDQVGGRRNVEVQEMLQVVDVDPRLQVASVELAQDDGQRATVRLTGADGTEHLLELVNEEGTWKVRLPGPRGPMGEP